MQDILQLWKAYACENKDVDLSLLPPGIALSWKRCRTYGVDPRLEKGYVVSQKELAAAKEKNRILIESALPYMHKLFRILGFNGLVVSLSDAEGLILEVLYDPMGQPREACPVEGAVESELYGGTSSIGVTVRTKSFSEVRGCEHWLEKNHRWYCFSAPVKYRDTFIGSLTASFTGNLPFDYQVIENMISALSYSIERELMLKEELALQKGNEIKKTLLFRYTDNGLIGLNKAGEIEAVNSVALSIFGAAGVWEGRKIDELIHSRADFYSLIGGQKQMDERDLETMVNSKYVHVIISTFLVADSGSGIALVIRGRNTQEVRKIVNKVTGTSARYTFDDIVASCPAMKIPMKFALLATKSDANVLITGETGTGKEVMVQAIHNASPRSAGPLVAINCGAVSPGLIRSELFGYEEGSFTGAKKGGSSGKFELAEGGTLFLDEIGDMPLEVQVMLLRVLQSREITRIGGNHPISVNVRIIAATNKNLEEMVKRSLFRDDLYFRLDVLNVVLPPLRERGDDIIRLARRLLDKYAAESGLGHIGFSEAVVKTFLAYRWPGNIRELENVVQRALLVCNTHEIGLEDIPENILANRKQPDRVSDPAVTETYKEDEDARKKEILGNLLARTNGNVKEAARALKLSRGTVYNMLSRYGMDATEFRKK